MLGTFTSAAGILDIPAPNREIPFRMPEARPKKILSDHEEASGTSLEESGPRGLRKTEQFVEQQGCPGPPWKGEQAVLNLNSTVKSA